MRLVGIFFFALCGLVAQTMVAPLAGTMVDAHGRVAMLHGVLGNLLPPEYAVVPAELQGQAIFSAAFGANGSAVKTDSQLVLLNGEGAVTSVQPAPAGTALFSFSSGGSPAWVLYAAEGELVNVATGASIGAAFGGNVAALGPAGSASIPLLSSDSDRQLWSGVVSLPGGGFQAQTAVSGSLPGAFFQSGWLTSSATGLLWTPLANGAATVGIALPETVRTIQTASAGAVVINSTWLLNARFQLVEIPQTPLPARRGTDGNPPGRAH